MGRHKRTKKAGPAGGLGVRYGVSVRKRYSATVTQMRQRYVCPQCGVRKVRRESVAYGHARNAVSGSRWRITHQPRS